MKKEEVDIGSAGCCLCFWLRSHTALHTRRDKPIEWNALVTFFDIFFSDELVKVLNAILKEELKVLAPFHFRKNGNTTNILCESWCLLVEIGLLAIFELFGKWGLEDSYFANRPSTTFRSSKTINTFTLIHSPVEPIYLRPDFSCEVLYKEMKLAIIVKSLKKFDQIIIPSLPIWMDLSCFGLDL